MKSYNNKNSYGRIQGYEPQSTRTGDQSYKTKTTTSTNKFTYGAERKDYTPRHNYGRENKNEFSKPNRQNLGPSKYGRDATPTRRYGKTDSGLKAKEHERLARTPTRIDRPYGREGQEFSKSSNFGTSGLRKDYEKRDYGKYGKDRNEREPAYKPISKEYGREETKSTPYNGENKKTWGKHTYGAEGKDREFDYGRSKTSGGYERQQTNYSKTTNIGKYETKDYKRSYEREEYGKRDNAYNRSSPKPEYNLERRDSRKNGETEGGSYNRLAALRARRQRPQPNKSKYGAKREGGYRKSPEAQRNYGAESERNQLARTASALRLGETDKSIFQSGREEDKSRDERSYNYQGGYKKESKYKFSKDLDISKNNYATGTYNRERPPASKYQYESKKWNKETNDYDRPAPAQNTYRRNEELKKTQTSSNFEKSDFGRKGTSAYESKSYIPSNNINKSQGPEPNPLTKSYNNYQPRDRRKSFEANPDSYKNKADFGTMKFERETTFTTKKEETNFSRRAQLTKSNVGSKSQTIIGRSKNTYDFSKRYEEDRKGRSPLKSSRSQLNFDEIKKKENAYVPSKPLVRRGINKHNYGYGKPPQNPPKTHHMNYASKENFTDRAKSWSKIPKSDESRGVGKGHKFGYNTKENMVHRKHEERERNFGRELKTSTNEVETPDNRPAFLTRVQNPPLKHNRIVRTQLKQTKEEKRNKENSIFSEKKHTSSSFLEDSERDKTQSPSFAYPMTPKSPYEATRRQNHYKREEEKFSEKGEKFRQTFGAVQEKRPIGGFNNHQYGRNDKEEIFEFSGIKARDELFKMSSIKEVAYSKETTSRKDTDMKGNWIHETPTQRGEQTPRTPCMLVVSQRPVNRNQLNTTFQRKTSQNTNKTGNSSQMYFSNFSFQKNSGRSLIHHKDKGLNTTITSKVSETFETAKPKKNIFDVNEQEEVQRIVAKKTLFELFCNESNFRTCKFMKRDRLVGICDDESEGFLKIKMINWRSKKLLMQRRFNCSKLPHNSL